MKPSLTVKSQCVVTGGRGLCLGVAAARAGVPVPLLDRASVPFSSHSYLCFESSKSGSSKRNKVIKLVDITDIQKVSGAPSPPSPLPLLDSGGGRPQGHEAGGLWMEVRCVHSEGVVPLGGLPF